jgi:hypothetical protein
MGPTHATPPPPRTAWFLNARASGRLVKVFGGQHKIVTRAGTVRPASRDLERSDNDACVADPFARIADEFLEAFRQGQLRSVLEFARRYPAHADKIGEILLALVLMQQAKSAEDTPRERRQADTAGLSGTPGALP